MSDPDYYLYNADPTQHDIDKLKSLNNRLRSEKKRLKATNDNLFGQFIKHFYQAVVLALLLLILWISLINQSNNNYSLLDKDKINVFNPLKYPQ